MNIIHFSIFLTPHLLPLKSYDYEYRFMARKYEKLEFVGDIFNIHNKKVKKEAYQRSEYFELENA